MDATAIGLLSLACPALTAVCLYRSNHRKHRTATTVVAWSLALPAVIGPLLAAQHTQGWGVVGWLLQLLTCAICIVHLAGWKLQRRKHSKTPRPHTAGRPVKGEPIRLAPMESRLPILQWGRDFLGTHQPWIPKQRPQALAEHREQIIKAMAEEAQALGRVDVLEDAMAEIYEAYGGKK